MKTETLTLGNYEFVITAVPARTGVRVAARLANALAPAVKALPEQGFEMDQLAMVRFIEPILSNPELSDTLDYLIATFSERTLVKDLDHGTQQPLSRVFDTQFSDAYDDFLKWLIAALRVSMSSFFRGVLEHAARLAVEDKSVSKSPSSVERTGKSGESS